MATRSVQHLVTQWLINSLLLCLAALMPLSAQAEFITDKITVDLHADRFPQSAVLKTLSSGSNVEVLISDGDYSRVRTSDNITGWVESKYLTNEKPTQLEYLELLTKSKTLEAKLKAAEDKLASTAANGNNDTQGIDPAELEELRKRANDAGWMRVELKKARDRADKFEAKLKAKGKAANSSEDELNSLRQQNQSLQKKLAAALLISEQQGTPTDGDKTPDTKDNQNQDWSVSISWFFGSIVVALIIGLIVGMTWLDNRIRQRHGGFRIY
jgi:SH3 domain protein